METSIYNFKIFTQDAKKAEMLFNIVHFVNYTDSIIVNFDSALSKICTDSSSSSV